MKLNLAFCIFKYYPFGGLEKNFFRIAEEVLRRGHSISVFTMKWEGALPSGVGAENFKVEILPTEGFSNHSRCYNFYNNVKIELGKNNFDLIVGYNKMPGLDLYYCADVCFEYESRKNKPFWFFWTPRYKIYSEFEKAVFSKNSSTAVLALSHIQQNIYMREYGIPSTRFYPVPAGIDKEKIRKVTDAGRRSELRSLFNVAEDENMLLMIGSDYKRKGVLRSVEALASLPEKTRSKTKLFILGRGKEAAVKKRASSLGVEAQLFIMGGVDNVPEYLAAADLLLHPALAENTGNAIVEALIAGVPVIATDNCGYAFHISEAEAGYVLPGEEFEQKKLNDVLLEFLELDPRSRTELSRNAHGYADTTDFYSRPSAVADIIESLSGQNK
jgi:UDP-glucose:(heptosyl)LPS alpha-1,3-glucosyltransferase